MKDIIINKNEDGSNLIALVENGKLIEKYDDDESIKANEGNIYCGIVRDLLPGMQSAFVDCIFCYTKSLRKSQAFSFICCLISN